MFDDKAGLEGVKPPLPITDQIKEEKAKKKNSMFSPPEPPQALLDLENPT